MTDREKVIKGLAEIIDYFFDVYRNETDSYKCEKAQGYSDCAIDALSLLKKQPEIVRCKDCKWYDEQISMCDNCKLPREQTFFCADGKRR